MAEADQQQEQQAAAPQDVIDGRPHNATATFLIGQPQHYQLCNPFTVFNSTVAKFKNVIITSLKLFSTFIFIMKIQTRVFSYIYLTRLLA